MSSGSKSFVLVPRGLHDCGGHRPVVCSNQKKEQRRKEVAGVVGILCLR